MKIFILAVAVSLGLVGLVLISQNKDSSATQPTSLSIQTIKNDIASGGLLIDVRTPEEYANSHINGASNLPLQNIQSGSLPAIAKDKPIYVYCHSGNRSSQAKAILAKAGYQNIIDLGAMTHVQNLGGALQP